MLEDLILRGGRQLAQLTISGCSGVTDELMLRLHHRTSAGAAGGAHALRTLSMVGSKALRHVHLGLMPEAKAREQGCVFWGRPHAGAAATAPAQLQDGTGGAAEAVPAAAVEHVGVETVLPALEELRIGLTGKSALHAGASVWQGQHEAHQCFLLGGRLAAEGQRQVVPTRHFCMGCRREDGGNRPALAHKAAAIQLLRAQAAGSGLPQAGAAVCAGKQQQVGPQWLLFAMHAVLCFVCTCFTCLSCSASAKAGLLAMFDGSSLNIGQANGLPQACKRLPVEALLEVLRSSCPTLVELDVQYYAGVDSSMVPLLRQACPTLQHVYITAPQRF